jgi:ABC-type uncharacterized transport system fused permease/ATPase subunit
MSDKIKYIVLLSIFVMIVGIGIVIGTQQVSVDHKLVLSWRNNTDAV